MHVVTLGDVALDVIVDAPEGLQPDDDTAAHITLTPGGQAANVAAWVVALGGTASLIGPAGHDAAAVLARSRLTALGVDIVAIDVGTSGKVVSILSGGTRTLASDPGDLAWVTRVGQVRLPAYADWLHVSGYPLWRADDPSPVLRAAAGMRGTGARISVDLASVSLMEAYGAGRVSDVLAELDPALVFANRAEWESLGLDQGRQRFDLVLKRGATGACFYVAGQPIDEAAHPGHVVDVTGAGDALAAGYLVGGSRLAMMAAAACVSQVGAQPGMAPIRPRH
jgi:ribokinase